MHTDSTLDPEPTPRIARRQFLAATCAASAAALAGCVGGPLAGQSTIDWTGELIESDARERHQVFGDRDVTLTVRQVDPAPPEDVVRVTPIPFFALLHHRDGLRTERLRLGLRAPPRDGSDFDARVYVSSPPNSRWPAVAVTEDAQGWTVVDVEGLGTADGGGYAPGDANVTVAFALVPTAAHPVDDLIVELDATVSERATLGRRQYSVRRTSRFPLVRDPADE